MNCWIDHFLIYILLFDHLYTYQSCNSAILRMYINDSMFFSVSHAAARRSMSNLFPFPATKYFRSRMSDNDVSMSSYIAEKKKIILTSTRCRAHVYNRTVGRQACVEEIFGLRVGAKINGPGRSDADNVGQESFKKRSWTLVLDDVPQALQNTRWSYIVRSTSRIRWRRYGAV